MKSKKSKEPYIEHIHLISKVPVSDDVYYRLAYKSYKGQEQLDIARYTGATKQEDGFREFNKSGGVQVGKQFIKDFVNQINTFMLQIDKFEHDRIANNEQPTYRMSDEVQERKRRKPKEEKFMVEPLFFGAR